VQIAVTDPLTAAVAFAYLFKQDGSLDPSAGKKYVTYTFSLQSGNYLTTYKTNNGPNPENSTASTSAYSAHWSDRWLQDQLKIFLAGGNNLIDRFKFNGGSCRRTEDTFDSGEGCFVINKSGPVRAIRSYMGANSGPYTQRTHFLYAQLQDILTDLRVHSSNMSQYDFLNFNSSVSGLLSYYDSNNLSGVLIDGKTDTISSTAPAWQMASGSIGSLNSVHQLFTTIQLDLADYYQDNSSTKNSDQCTGSKAAFGAHGVSNSGRTTCTDPRPSVCPSPGVVQAHRWIFYGPAGMPASAAQNQSQRINNPLQMSASLWP